MIEALIALIIFGAVLYLVQILPIDATIKRIIQVIAIVIAVIWAIKTFLPMAGLN